MRLSRRFDFVIGKLSIVDLKPDDLRNCSRFPTDLVIQLCVRNGRRLDCTIGRLIETEIIVIIKSSGGGNNNGRNFPSRPGRKTAKRIFSTPTVNRRTSIAVEPN